MNSRFYRDLLKQHGVGAACYHLAYRAANRVLDLRVWNTLVITLDTIDACCSRMLPASAKRARRVG